MTIQSGFDNLGLNVHLQLAVKEAGYLEPTPIQRPQLLQPIPSCKTQPLGLKPLCRTQPLEQTRLQRTQLTNA